MRLHRSSAGRLRTTATAAKAAAKAAVVVALTAVLLLTSFPCLAETTSTSLAADRQCVLQKRSPPPSDAAYPVVPDVPIVPNNGTTTTPDQGAKEEEKKERDPSAPCDTYTVQRGDGCKAIADKFTTTEDLLTAWNAKRTWGWEGCNHLKAEQVICVTVGVPPLPKVEPTAVCGLQSVGNKTCPSGACCSRWGYCGTTDEHCTVDPNGNLGVGCQSQCSGIPPQTVFDPKFKVCDEQTMSRRLVYYEGWAATRQCNPVHAKDLDPTLFTDLHFAFGEISEDFQVSIPYNESLQLNDIKALKQRNPNLRIALSMGGWGFNDPPPEGTVLPEGTTRKCDRFSNMAKTPENRAKFVESVYAFLKDHNFDGIDVDWEFPGAKDRCGTTEDGKNYVELVKDLRARLDPKQTVSIAISGADHYLQGTDLRNMEPYLDYLIVMSYDLAGQWDFKYGGAKVFAHTDLKKVTGSIDRLTQFGIHSNKIMIGVASYGRPAILADPTCIVPGCKFVEGQVPVPPRVCRIDPYTLTYPEVLKLQRSLTTNYSVNQDNDAAVKVMAFERNQYWVTYDDPATLRAKVNAGLERCLAGYSLWAVDQDLPDFELTRALYEAVDEGKKETGGTINGGGDNDAKVEEVVAEKKEEKEEGTEKAADTEKKEGTEDEATNEEKGTAVE